MCSLQALLLRRPDCRQHLNHVKVTGANITYGGGVFPGLEYAQVPAGNLALEAVVPATATAPEAVAVTGAVDVAAGKTYSIFLIDTLSHSFYIKNKKKIFSAG